MRAAVIASASIPALCIFTPQRAHAQGDDAAVEEVVVSARRREERLQDVPQAISTVSAAVLQSGNVTELRQITQMMPSVNMPQSGTNVLPMIRGIGSTNAGVGDENNVSIYIDNVYQPDPLANNLQLSNISRVEVLRGPQGTLFGRNSAGGAFLITTRSPSENFYADATASYGRFNDVAAAGYVSGPLSSTIAGDLSVSFERQDAFAEDVIRGDALADMLFLVVRSKVVIDAGDDTQVTLGGMATYSNDSRGNWYQPYKGNVSYRNTFPDLPVPTEPNRVALTFSPKNMVHQWQGFVRLQREFENFSFQSQTSRTFTVNHNVTDTDYGPPNSANSAPYSHIGSWQQEFLFNSTGTHKIDWTAGLFLFELDSRYVPRSVNLGLPSFNQTYSTTKADSIAPFGEATWHIDDRWSLTAGLRYTWERKKATSTLLPNAQQTGSKSWTALTPRVVLQYEVPDALNIYASYSEGFKSGVFSLGTPDPNVDPERVNAYELGLKTLYPGRWRASGALYYTEYKDIQVLAFNTPTCGVTCPPPQTQLINATSGTAYGVEFEAHGQVTSSLSADVFASYSHTEYDEFKNAIIQALPPTGYGTVQVRNYDATGLTFTRAPEWQAGLGLTYQTPLAGGEFKATASYAYNGGFGWEISARNKQEAYGVLNGTISWTPESQDVTYSLWGTNLTDEDYAVSGNSTAFGDYRVVARPISVGVRVSMRWE